MNTSMELKDISNSSKNMFLWRLSNTQAENSLKSLFDRFKIRNFMFLLNPKFI